ncbi:hypothetical protein [Aquabacterium sp.]|uniref:hypothetical protein n=1 Tax=Aquabacterium sp. TaxID=1872578 RepID=UPI0024889E39|nr:hypothetical protein [Aquabacterium sp.]MDI1259591.1 hypothetical protein [Aquabacterium sp.]
MHVKAEHCRRIDVRRFARENMLRVGSWGWQWTDSDTGRTLASIGIIGTPHALRLEYAVDGVPRSEQIDITRTACAYGSERPWFKCPKCWGRVALLFLRQSRFACRKRHKLAYVSQSLDTCGRAWRKQSKLEARLGPNWRRPKGMHRATRERILEAIWECEATRDVALADYLGRVGFNGWR